MGGGNPFADESGKKDFDSLAYPTKEVSPDLTSSPTQLDARQGHNLNLFARTQWKGGGGTGVLHNSMQLLA